MEGKKCRFSHYQYAKTAFFKENGHRKRSQIAYFAPLFSFTLGNKIKA